MTSLRFVRCGLAFLGLAMAACSDGAAAPPGAGGEDPYWCCDPDDTSCTCQGYWHCTEEATPGGKRCAQDNPDLPDDAGASSWDCQYEGNDLTCTGDAGDHPDAGGDSGWTCETQGEFVTCTRDADDGDFPDGGGDWDCSYLPDGTQRVCDETGGDSGSTDDSGSGADDSGSSDDSGNPDGFLCSYGMVVFTYQGETWVVRVDKGASTCTETNQTSSDSNFSYECNGSTYDNEGFVFNRDADPVPAYSGDCSQLFEISNRRVRATAAGVNIIYGVTHDGSLPNHFGTLCPPPEGTTELVFPDSCN